MLLHKLQRYIEEPEDPRRNYDLAKEYERLEQHSSSCGYFLRAADRSNDRDFIYDCVIGAARSLIEHGDNLTMVKFLLQNALQLDPSRSEAYYFIALSHKYDNDSEFSESYKKYLAVRSKNQKKELYDIMDLNEIAPRKNVFIPTIRFSNNKENIDFRHRKLEV